MKIVECVPNFSEGCDMAKIAEITKVVEAVPGVTLLDVDPGADTNRTVVTFVGDPDAVAEAAFQAVKRASEVIDMRTHKGAHPRMGATDVCPFVPVEGVTMEDCAEIARQVGKRIGEELQIPVFLYENAAATDERRNLAVVRQGEYEGLEARLADPRWKPDFGPAQHNAKAGATAVGAREFLIAYNITLNTRDKAMATDIAFELREKGRVARRGQTSALYSSGEVLRYEAGKFPCGNCDAGFDSFEEVVEHAGDAHYLDLPDLLRRNGVDPLDVVGQKVYRGGMFASCKAIGWFVDEYERAQISLNLTDYRVTPPHLVLEAARTLAGERGLVVTGSEVIGLIPLAALEQAGRYYLTRQGKTAGVPQLDALKVAVHSMGLNDVDDFDLRTRVFGLPRVGGLAATPVGELVDEVSRDTPAPGGGSIAALTGALGAALASMVANLTHGRTGDENRDLLMDEVAVEAQRVKAELVKAVDADTEAFNAYLTARRLPRGTGDEKAARASAMQAGLREAVRVPLRTAELSLQAMHLASQVARHGNPRSITDGAVGCQAGHLGVRGGVWNARINLAGITDRAFVDATEARCKVMLIEADQLLGATTQYVDEQITAAINAAR